MEQEEPEIPFLDDEPDFINDQIGCSENTEIDFSEDDENYFADDPIHIHKGNSDNVSKYKSMKTLIFLVIYY